MTTICSYTVCLNEIKHIERWLEATKDSDLRVIVDTGSTDGTWERLQELADDTLQVHRISVIPWRFDDARNAALALVPDWVDVCASIDMDEVPQPGFFQILKKEWKPETTIGWHRIDTGTVWEVTRLHTRKGFHWKYPCHEVFAPYGKTEEVVQKFDIQIDHQPDNDKSRGQYLDLLEMAVEETPNNGRMWTYLAREYYFHKKWNQILDASMEAVNASEGWHTERAFACRLAVEACYELGLDAKHAVLQGLEFDPESIEMQYVAAYYYYRIKDWEKCWEHSSKRLTLQETNHYLKVDDVWNWRCYDMMAISSWYMGNKEDAIKYQKLAIDGVGEGEDHTRLVTNLEMMERGL